jgi:integrase
MSLQDMTEYLGSIQRDRTEDPDQSWINSQKAYCMPLLKFFKWRAYPDLTAQQRKHMPRDKCPPMVKGLIFPTKKGSKSPVKAKDIWNDQDVAIFLKYCYDNPRLQFYHALAYETSGRPGELLQLRVGDIQVESDDEGRLYAALDIGRYGKRSQSRIVGITEFSIQYYQRYLSTLHPNPTNKDAFVFISRERSAYARNVPISIVALRADYIAFRDKTIPKLLKRPDISEADKKHLQTLREEKRWNPYTLRHSSITKLARSPHVNDYTLRQHAGWTKRSDMVEIYTHELKGDSFEDVMLAYGIDLKSKNKKQNQRLQQELVGPHCPFCHTVNIPGTQLCSSCGRPITPTSYQKVMEEAEESKKKMKELEAKQEILQANAANILRALMAAEVRGGEAKPPAPSSSSSPTHRVEIITWNADQGSEALFAAAELARVENQKREREHQQRHHDPNDRRLAVWTKNTC